MLPSGFTVLDVETTYQVGEKGKGDPTPYNPANRLVSVGYIRNPTYAINTPCLEDYFCFYHSQEPPTPRGRKLLQDALSDTYVMIGHNIKFDLGWLLECGFTYNGVLWDTMVVEYVLSKGVKRPLDLDSCLKRYKLEGKDERIKEYMDNKVSFENIPWSIVREYGLQDIRGTEQLFLKQLEEMGVRPEDIV